MINSYLIQIKTKHFGVFDLVVSYNQFGDLIAAEWRNITSQMSDMQRDWLWNFVPRLESQVQEKAKNKDVTVQEIEKDLSFETFWDLYDYKTGNKKRAQAHWGKLDDATRIKVLTKVKEYNYYMQHQSHAKVFAERFLAQKRYENEFNIT